MKWLFLLAVFILSQHPAEAPKDKRTTEANRAKSTAHAKNAESNQIPSAQPTPAPAQAPVATESQRSAATANDHTRTSTQQTSDEGRSTQRKLTCFTGVLATVGVLQLVVMFLTWLIYRRQAREMRRQRHEMVRQRTELSGQRAAMESQLETMQGQLAAMKESAGQTDRLIEQAGKQVEQLTISAEAAKNSADAAKRNAEAATQAVAIVISKERARVSIVANVPPSLSLAREQIVKYKVHFSGPTAAFVLEARAGASVSESDKPPTSILMFDLPYRREVSPTTTPQWDTSAILLPRLEQESDLRDVIEGKKFIHFWCFIKYRDVFYDVFHEERETSFRRVWKFADSPVGGNMPIPTELGGRFGAWHTYGYDEDNKAT